MFALLNIHKPAGCTSRDVVNQVARIVGRKVKVGHAGTLDPLARGVLLVCLGPATRLVPFIHEHSKTYRGSFRLGLSSDTEDITGQLQAVPIPATIDETAMREALPRFLGEIMQAPPAYSAVKVAGRRAYDVARGGESVELAPRPVLVHRIQLLEFSPPDFTLEIECGTGTYVRSLGRDIAAYLGASAVMTDLLRSRIGPFPVEGSIPLENLSRDVLRDAALSPLAALPHLPRVEVDEKQITAIRQGRSIPMPPAAAEVIEGLSYPGGGGSRRPTSDGTHEVQCGPGGTSSSTNAEFRGFAPSHESRCALVSCAGELISIAQRHGSVLAPSLVFPARE